MKESAVCHHFCSSAWKSRPNEGISLGQSPVYWNQNITVLVATWFHPLLGGRVPIHRHRSLLVCYQRQEFTSLKATREAGGGPDVSASVYEAWMSLKPLLSFVLGLGDFLCRKTVQHAFWPAPACPRFHAPISKLSTAGELALFLIPMCLSRVVQALPPPRSPQGQFSPAA